MVTTDLTVCLTMGSGVDCLLSVDGSLGVGVYSAALVT